MDAYFVCLANSLKRGGRCIAGVEVTVAEGRWTVVKKADGTPKWIRPIDAITDFGEITLVEARAIQLLSVVKLRGVMPIPSQAHQEDVHYTQMTVVGKVSPSDPVLSQFLDTFHPVLFYGTDRAISIETYERADHSLMFVRADRSEIVADVREDKTRYRMLLGYKGVTYDLSVTDPDFIEKLNEGQISVGVLQNVYVTISLGLVYEGRHHKLVAAVVSATSGTASNEILPINVRINREVSFRSFTKEERKTVKQAFIVPSQNGFAVCFRRKNGGEDFLPLYQDDNIKPWKKISLKTAVLVNYDDGTTKVRVQEQKTIAERFLHFIKSRIK